MYSIFIIFISVTFFLTDASSNSLVSRADEENCVISDYSQVKKKVSKCLDIVIDGISVPSGKQLWINLNKGSTLTFKGEISFAFKNWAGPLVYIHGENVTVKGENGHFFNGHGELYWDGKGGLGTLKPTFMHIHTAQDSLFESLNLLNCPERCVSIQSEDTTFNNWNIDVSLGHKRGGHNTDGFDISHGKNLVFRKAIIKNQDDCVAINSGSNLKFFDFECHGSHGLSLSIGTSENNGTQNTAENILFSNCKVIDSDNGIHIKTHPNGGTGVISNVVYENIEFRGIKRYGIDIEQDYEDKGHLKCNIPIQNLTITNVKGNVVNKNGNNVYIACAKGGCDHWNWSGVDISGGRNKCNYKPNGFQC